MKTITTETRKFCASVAKNCEKLAKSKPNKSIRRIVIKPIQGGGKLDIIGNDLDSYLPSEFVAEVFAIKEDGNAIYSAITYE